MPDTTIADRPVIGFVGLGDQGAPLAQAIADAGFPLHAWARRPASLAALDGRPYSAHETLADLARAVDVVALCLREDSDILELVEQQGLLEHMRPGSVLVNHGTGLPATAHRLQKLAGPSGIHIVDAPVSGGHAVAVARELTTIAGGDDAALRLVTPVFESFSKQVIHVGPAGAGQYGKLFNNAVMMMNHKNLLDALAVARALDLPLAPLLDVLRSGSAASFALSAFGPSITAQNADHLRELELIDMDLFAAATAGNAGEERDTVVARAAAGARGLPELTRMTGN
ncbi:NAD(P)-dependent oxidoreductase [Streptomyces sp. WMMC500]|uniref:NAD(P)-dependent oxidoreductase n=1 Tax=Streptomyces sp. WMMC500 TaxID=3015154 RepID=UPI00248CCB19|nr:NAD(P)-dependent oxidoreductase [Streptomyces sp. WMMC500]WBB59376.1 NAD(P)-dependent oxidoreductase [Streptomyces sp. WMMC500]